MTQRDDLDRMLSAWLDDPYTPPAPRYLTQVLERTRHTRQRPAWANLERWLPMADKILRARPTAPPMRMARLLLIALLVVALAAAAAVVGSRLLTLDARDPPGRRGRARVRVRSRGNSGLPVGDLFTVRADGTDLRQLTRTRRFGLDDDPVLSPDGTRIAYRGFHRSQNSSRSSSWTRLAGTGPRLATNSASAGRVLRERDDLAWSPDG